MSKVKGLLDFVNAARKYALNKPASYVNQRYSTNIPNFLEGAYSGQTARTAAFLKGFSSGAAKTTVQAASPIKSKAFRDTGISSVTHKILKEGIQDLNFESQKRMMDTQMVSHIQNKLHHQIIHNYGLNEKYGGTIAGMDKYVKRHAGLSGDGAAILPYNLKKINPKVYTDKEIKRRIDDVLNTWGLQEKGKPISFLELYPTKFHQSHRDIQMWNPKAIDFFIEMKKYVDKGGRDGFVDFFKRSKVEDVGDFLQVTTSPKVKSNYYMGGFNGKILYNKKNNGLELLPTDVLDIGSNSMLGKMISMVAERGAQKRVVNYMRTKAIKIPEIKRLQKKKRELGKSWHDVKEIENKYEKLNFKRKSLNKLISGKLDYNELKERLGARLKWTKEDIDAINQMMELYEGVSMKTAKDWGRYLAPRTAVASAAIYSGFDWNDD